MFQTAHYFWASTFKLFFYLVPESFHFRLSYHIPTSLEPFQIVNLNLINFIYNYILNANVGLIFSQFCGNIFKYSDIFEE